MSPHTIGNAKTGHEKASLSYRIQKGTGPIEARVGSYGLHT